MCHVTIIHFLASRARPTLNTNQHEQLQDYSLCSQYTDIGIFSPWFSTLYYDVTCRFKSSAHKTLIPTQLRLSLSPESQPSASIPKPFQSQVPRSRLKLLRILNTDVTPSILYFPHVHMVGIRDIQSRINFLFDPNASGSMR